MAFSFLNNRQLQDLRRQGIFQYSSWTSRLIVLVSLSGYFYFSGDKLIPMLLSFYQNLFSIHDLNLMVVGQFWSKLLFDFIFIPTLLLILSILIGGLLQTKFYLRFNSLAFDLGQLGLKAQLQKIKPIKRILFGLAFPILFFILLMLTISWVKNLLIAFSWAQEESLVQYLSLFKSIASQIAIVAVLLIFLATILNWFYFRLEHRNIDHDLAEDSANQSAIDSIR